MELTDIEDRYQIYKQDHSSDRVISHLIFSFKLNVCKFQEGSERNNVLVRLLKKDDAQNSNVTCPFKKNSRVAYTNKTYDDNLLPPVPVEILARCHKESYGKLKGMKKWVKLFTEDIYMKVKK